MILACAPFPSVRVRLRPSTHPWSLPVIVSFAPRQLPHPRCALALCRRAARRPPKAIAGRIIASLLAPLATFIR